MPQQSGGPRKPAPPPAKKPSPVGYKPPAKAAPKPAPPNTGPARPPAKAAPAKAAPKPAPKRDSVPPGKPDLPGPRKPTPQEPGKPRSLVRDINNTLGKGDPRKPTGQYSGAIGYGSNPAKDPLTAAATRQPTKRPPVAPVRPPAKSTPAKYVKPGGRQLEHDGSRTPKGNPAAQKPYNPNLKPTGTHPGNPKPAKTAAPKPTGKPGGVFPSAPKAPGVTPGASSPGKSVARDPKAYTRNGKPAWDLMNPAEKAAHVKKYGDWKTKGKPKPGATTGNPYIDNAKSAVGMELDPKLNDLQRQIDLSIEQTDRERSRTEQFGQQAEGDLSELFGRLGNFTGRITDQQNANYGQAQQQTSDVWNRLREQTGGAFDQAANAQNAELARLGLGPGAALESGAGLQRDKTYLTELGSLLGQSAQSRLTAQQGGFNDLMGFAAQTAGAEGASQIAGTRRETQDQLGELSTSLQDQLYNLRGKKGDIEGTRGERTRQIMEALRDKDYARNMEQRQVSFQEYLAKQNLALDQQRTQAATQPQAVDPLDTAYKLAQIANLQETTNKAGTNPGKGLTDAIAYIDRTAGGDPRIAGELKQILNIVSIGGAGYTKVPYKTDGSDPRMFEAINESLKGRGFGPVQRDVLMNAVQIFMGKA